MLYWGRQPSASVLRHFGGFYMNESIRRRNKNSAKSVSLPRACGQSLLTGFLTSAVLLLIAVSVSYAQADPVSFALPASLATLYLSIAASGFTAARKSDAPLLAGVIVGAVWLVLILLLSLIAGDAGGCGFGTVGSLFAHTAIPVASLLGAYIGKRRVKRPSSHHKKRRR